MINLRTWWSRITPDTQSFIATVLLTVGVGLVILGVSPDARNGFGDVPAWLWHTVSTVATWAGLGVERVVHVASFGHVTLYAEPVHSGGSGGFVAWQGFGRCAGVSWYGHLASFHGCG